MVWQLIQEAFELDGRIARSLKLLFAKPGQLSVEFSNNRRADFISPIRLYLFTSILFFAVMSLTSDGVPLTVDRPPEERQIQLDMEVDTEALAKFEPILW